MKIPANAHLIGHNTGTIIKKLNQRKQKCKKFIMVFKYNALRELIDLTL